MISRLVNTLLEADGIYWEADELKKERALLLKRPTAYLFYSWEKIKITSSMLVGEGFTRESLTI